MINQQEGSITARICAWIRATHSRSDYQKIFDDSLAGTLLGRKNAVEVSHLLHNNTHSPRTVAGNLALDLFPIPISRSAWAETEIHAFADAHESIQHVLLGAGMDTFAWRNRLSNITTFEVDHPLSQQSKLSRLKAIRWDLGRAVFVAVDFAVDNLKEKLLSAGFNPIIPTVFTILGVSYYLPLKTFENTLKEISELMSAPTRVLFDFQDDTEDEFARKMSDFTASLGEPMAKGYNVEKLKSALNSSGYRGLFHLSPKDIEERYFRSRTDGLNAFGTVHFIKAAI
ncbi:MAG: class I SAM-dependent methyltransferase [Succinivibrio sp.]|nr:class I SAM-dependent methyltransferase [Succinivibrio sp.]